MGQVSLYNIDLEKGEAEYGRLMIWDSAARRQGLARRATVVLISWAFNFLSLKTVYLNVFKNNVAAVNLYLSCGFVICGERDNLFVMQILQQRYFQQIN
jgi:diamine N-acetyltransferase